MRRLKIVLSSLFLSLVTTGLQAQLLGTIPNYAPGQIIVGYHDGIPAAERTTVHVAQQAQLLRRLERLNADLVRVPERTLAAKIAAYRAHPAVRYAEPNYKRIAIIPSEGADPPPPVGMNFDYFTEQWGLNNTGQTIYYYTDPNTGLPVHGAINATAGADINAPEAWEVSQGDAGVTVAVLDTGVNCDHVDLANKCIASANFTDDPQDDEFGHGTHVAGIAAAETDNGVGISGVGWNTTIADIKVCHKELDLSTFTYIGVCDAADVAAGVSHASAMGFQVINMSFSGPDQSQAEADAMTDAWDNGAVLVAAAGNGYADTLALPAAHLNVIAVGSFDWHGNLSAFSNFGDWVDLAAPGDLVFSTFPGSACGIPDTDPDGCYNWLSGTSMAAPQVAGAAALVFAHLGAGTDNVAVRAVLESSANPTGPRGQNWLAWTAHGMLDLAAAVSGGPPPPPPEANIHIGDLDGSAVNSGRNWSATVTITLHDETETGVAGVRVDGTWSGGHSGSDFCTTDLGGSCSVVTPIMLKRDSSSVVFVIDSVASADYDVGQNHDPDGDSDGNAISVSR